MHHLSSSVVSVSCVYLFTARIVLSYTIIANIRIKCSVFSCNLSCKWYKWYFLIQSGRWLLPNIMYNFMTRMNKIIFDKSRAIDANNFCRWISFIRIYLFSYQVPVYTVCRIFLANYFYWTHLFLDCHNLLMCCPILFRSIILSPVIRFTFSSSFFQFQFKPMYSNYGCVCVKRILNKSEYTLYMEIIFIVVIIVTHCPAYANKQTKTKQNSHSNTNLFIEFNSIQLEMKHQQTKTIPKVNFGWLSSLFFCWLNSSPIWLMWPAFVYQYDNGQIVSTRFSYYLTKWL